MRSLLVNSKWREARRLGVKMKTNRVPKPEFSLGVEEICMIGTGVYMSWLFYMALFVKPNLR